MIKIHKYIFLILFFLIFCNYANASSSKVKGDPSEIFASPLGTSDIENNAYNRCLLIKKLKPGVDKSSDATRAAFTILGNYATRLYAQSIKLATYISEEDEDDKNDVASNIEGGISIIEQEVVARLADIARRINIINSFEAATSMVNALKKIKNSPSSSYEKFRDKNFEYVTECEKLK